MRQYTLEEIAALRHTKHCRFAYEGDFCDCGAVESDEVNRLEARVAELEAIINDPTPAVAVRRRLRSQDQRVRVMEAQEEDFWDVLATYGQHTHDCASHTSRDGRWLDCDCGWEEHPLNPINRPKG